MIHEQSRKIYVGNFSADGFKGNEAVAIFVQFEAGLAGHFHLQLGLLVFSGGGGISVGFSLLFNVGARSGETRGDDLGWLVVFLWSSGSEGSPGRL